MPKNPENDIHRIQFEASKELSERIQKLRKAIGASSQAELFRRLVSQAELVMEKAETHRLALVDKATGAVTDIHTF